MRAGAIGPLLGLLAILPRAPADEGDGTLLLKDPATRRAERRVHDVTSAELRAGDGRMTVRILFREELKDSIFTLATLSIDCDNDPATGLGGRDLQILAGVGSRYRALAAEPAQPDDPAPLELRRACYAVVEAEATVRGHPGPSGMWLYLRKTSIAPPTIDGREFVFSFPLTLLRENGLRYNDTVRLSLDVEGTISEEVVSLHYVCDDEGIEIEVDGDARDWPAGEAPQAKDAEDDLHPCAREVDLVGVFVDHDADHLFARVRLAAGGFADAEADDILDADRVYLGVEPVGDQAYMPYVEVVAIGGMPAMRAGRSRGAGNSYASGNKLVEFAVPRRSEQARFRVMAWTDANRTDRIPDEGTALFKIPREAWGDE